MAGCPSLMTKSARQATGRQERRTLPGGLLARSFCSFDGSILDGEETTRAVHKKVSKVTYL